MVESDYMERLTKFLFWFFSLVFLSSFVFGGCIPGSSYCVDATTVNVCLPDGSGFVSITCVAGCDFNTGKCRTLGPDSCDIKELGKRRCSPTNPNMPQFCDGTTWQDDPPQCTYGCDPTRGVCFECANNDPPQCSGNVLVTCVNGYKSYRDCAALGLVCDSTAKACVAPQANQCSKEGIVYCDGQVLKLCQRDPKTNTLVGILFDDCGGFGCDVNSNQCFNCKSGDPPQCSGNVLVTCVNGFRQFIACQLGCYEKNNQPPGYCKVCDPPNTNQCVGPTSYITCTQDFIWSNPINCPTGLICVNGNCVATNQGGGGGGQQGGGAGGAGGGSSGSRGSFSGGGEVKPCVSYSEWVVNSTTEFKKDNKNCILTTYISYCVKADGTIDKYRFKTNSSTECYDDKKPQICNYIFARSENYLDNSTMPGQCRNCTKDIFYYTCDGVQDITNKKEVVSCSDFYSCEQKEEKKNEYEQFISSYWPLLLFILLLGIVVVGYYLWKSSEKKEEK